LLHIIIQSLVSLSPVTVKYTKAKSSQKDENEYQNDPKVSVIEINNDLSVFNFN
jgi:hypothetical protein